MGRFALASLALALVACGNRSLELVVAIAPDCRFSIPAGGSLQYELGIGSPDGGAPQRVCGACIPVTTDLNDTAGVLALLRTAASPCAVTRDTPVRVRITSFAGAGCTAAAEGPVGDRLCAESASLPSAAGTSDQRLAVSLSCAAGCDSSTCVPTTCAIQGKNCGSLPNGCGASLDCGTCSSSEKCGGGDDHDDHEANVCRH